MVNNHYFNLSEMIFLACALFPGICQILKYIHVKALALYAHWHPYQARIPHKPMRDMQNLSSYMAGFLISNFETWTNSIHTENSWTCLFCVWQLPPLLPMPGKYQPPERDKPAKEGRRAKREKRIRFTLM